MPPPIPRPRSVRRAVASYFNRNPNTYPHNACEALADRYDVLVVLGAFHGLRTQGLLDQGDDGRVTITDAGLARWRWQKPEGEEQSC